VNGRGTAGEIVEIQGREGRAPRVLQPSFLRHDVAAQRAD